MQNPLPGKRVRWLFVLLAPLLAACGLRAQLNLTIDTINKTYWWTGSASISGTLEAGGLLYGRLIGGDGYDAGYTLGSSDLNYTVIAFNPYMFGNAIYVNANGLYTEPLAWENDHGYDMPYAGTFSASDSGLHFSYATVEPEAASFLLTFDGLPITFNGTGERVGTISVILPPPPAAVPEPATYALALGCAALGGVAWRRRRRIPASIARDGA